MDKIAFNDAYRFLAANIPSRRDLLQKERAAYRPSRFGDARKMARS
jgi:hypothetical protein